MPAQVDEQADEQLVALRRGVLNDVEHAVGNLLQRMHHAARAATDAVQGERLQLALDDLERLLELFFDYVSPVDVQVRPTAVPRIAESLVAQLRGQGGGEVNLTPAPETDGLQVLADPRVLSRSFLLLAQSYSCEGGSAVAVEAVHDPDGDRVQFLVQPATETAAVPSAHNALAAAVAGRLIELQGGELQERPRPGCMCAVVLPAAS